MGLAPTSQLYLFIFSDPEVIDTEMFMGYVVFDQFVEYVCYVVQQHGFVEFCPLLSLPPLLLDQLLYAAQHLLGLQHYLGVPLAGPRVQGQHL